MATTYYVLRQAYARGLLAFTVLSHIAPAPLFAQDGPAAPPPQVNAAAVGLNGIGAPAGGPAGPGGQGGAASADFDSLIDLITSTVARDSWLENGTGEGEIQPFAINGVYVDAAGAVRLRAGQSTSALSSVRSAGNQRGPSAPRDVRATSQLRFVSLPRLEAAIANCQARKAPLASEMLTLAGLQSIRYVLIYPDSGDLVVAGPAGDWAAVPGGGIVAAETGRPVVRLDDLIALWRRQRTEQSSAFGCSIVPRQDALAKVQEYLSASSGEAISPGQRRQWLDGLRDALGVQDVEYYHIDPDSRLAGLLFFADYHMKLIGMGLADGVPGVKSYLAFVSVGADGQPPAMSVLRWWFSMPKLNIEATPAHDAFALPEQCIEVLSENEMLAARGERVHTGQSEDLNREFAASFTANFAAIADKYPVYGELQRAFELALVLALIEREGLADRVQWNPRVFLDEAQLRLPKGRAPHAVETVINHRVLGGRHIIAGVSGGVWLDGGQSLTLANASGGRAAQLGSVKKAPAQDHGTAGGRQVVWWWD